MTTEGPEFQTIATKGGILRNARMRSCHPAQNVAFSEFIFTASLTLFAADNTAEESKRERPFVDTDKV